LTSDRHEDPLRCDVRDPEQRSQYGGDGAVDERAVDEQVDVVQAVTENREAARRRDSNR
jgi:hypothetical protein